MEKQFLDRRLSILRSEGINFQTNTDVGVTLPAQTLQREFDAMLLAGGAGRPRDLEVLAENSKAYTSRWNT